MIKVFEGRRVDMGAQIRFQVIPNGYKTLFRNKKIENQRKRAPRAANKIPKSFGSVWPGIKDPASKRQPEQFGRPRPPGVPLFAWLDKH